MGFPMPSSFAFIEWRMFPTVTTIATCAAFWGRRYMATVELEQTSMDLPWPVAIAGGLAIMGATLYAVVTYPTAMEYFMRATMVAAICYNFGVLLEPAVVAVAGRISRSSRAKRLSQLTYVVGLALGLGWLECARSGWHWRDVNQLVVVLLGVVVGGLLGGQFESFRWLTASMWAAFCYDYTATRLAMVHGSRGSGGVAAHAGDGTVVLGAHACRDYMMCAARYDVSWRIPNVLLIGNGMLGLGDIAAGGLVATYALAQYGASALALVLVAFNVGLLVALVWSQESGTGVPALVPIVPFTWVVLALFEFGGCRARAYGVEWGGARPGSGAAVAPRADDADLDADTGGADAEREQDGLLGDYAKHQHARLHEGALAASPESAPV